MRRPKRIVIQRNSDGIDETFAWLRRGPLAIDTETTGLHWYTERVGSINFAAGDTAVFAYRDALGPAARWLSDQIKAGRELVFHHAKFDMHHLWKTFGIHIPYPVHDTAVQSFLIDNRGVRRFGNWKDKPHGLKPLAEAFIDPDAQDFEKEMMRDIKAKGGRHKGDWLIADEKYFAEYSAMDPWYTLRLHEIFYDWIKHWVQPHDEECESLLSLYETEQWVILATRDMEQRGIMANREFLEEWRVRLEKALKKRRRRLEKLAGREINWNSPTQLRELLFSKRPHGLGLTSERRSKSGHQSTDAVALLGLKHAIGPELVKYREENKQYTSYAVSLQNHIMDDGAIHPTFRTTGAETGRMSCVEPNLQQQTRVSGVRKAYYPRKGLQFRFADYSQVEMRLAAHFANEAVLIEGFKHDPDFDTHGATATTLYGHPPEDGTQQRKFGKILNFTKIFGGGEDKITEQLVNLLEQKEAEDGLRELGVNPKRLGPGLTPWRALAQQLIQRLNIGMPGLVKAVRDEARVAERRGFVTNAFGRRRYLDDEKWYKAFNTKVQGTAGDQAKRGLVAVYRECQLNRGELALLLQIHDENIYESDGDPAVDRRVLELMQEVNRFKVPLIADMKGSKTSWQDKESVKL